MALSLFFFRKLLWMSMYPHNSVMTMKAGVPPEISASPTTKAIRNPPSAVMNHPATTVITPEMRYTALSRPHARSASDEPIATMKQT